ncbi:hypothetical protein SELMODRAFT_404931 [Selaginella moellendorffii]|uniref:Prolyl 4-hydroxylase alpha subunit Fe(2+) 2OG dioxygenase domain-containing protein n=1 Tax=Selaginella moellendorffii TaxID=88036 RepID=D8QXU5_SELML|nr:hypothetical protein SELMODRAFT_404931 [Selaginella moellendorffii]
MDYEALLKVLWSSRPKFASGGEVDGTKFPMPTSLRVEGAGDLALPLSSDGFLKLKAVSQQAPYGKGDQTLFDTTIRRAWQVEASKVSCPQMPDFFSAVVLNLAVPAMEELGIDAAALGLDVRLYKLLLYERGGHFKFHKDTEKEDGMFGTMILQLPTQSGHEGGALEIRHGKKGVAFDFSGAASRTGYFQTVFFSDCDHRLAEVTSGTRLCLVFSLVRSNAKFLDVDAGKVPHYLSTVRSVQSQLKEWARRTPSLMLAIPLGHKYSNNSFSFAGLRGHDRVVAALVLSCTSFLDVHLCTIVKQKTRNEVFDSFKTNYSVKNWTAIDGRKLEHFRDCCLDLDTEVVRCQDSDKDPFGGSPDAKEYEPYNGNAGGDKNSFYHTAALLVWPKEHIVDVLCNRQPVRCVVTLLEEQHEREPGRTSGDLERYISALESRGPSEYKKSFETLLEFCVRHDFRDAAFLVMKNWGIKLMETSQAMVAAVHKYGWDECYSRVIEGLLEEKNKWPEVLRFAEHLRQSGLQDAAVIFAQKLLADDQVCKDHAFLTCLLGFFVECGRDDETWKIVVKKWGESSFSRIEEFWEKKLEIYEASWEKRAEELDYGYGYYSLKKSDREKEKKEKLAKLQQKGRREFLGEVADFAVKLESEGCHDAAMAFARKSFIKDISLEEIFGCVDMKISSEEAFVLLLAQDEKFHEAVKKSDNLEETVVSMKKAAGLFGLKEDEKVTQLFLELLSCAFEKCGCESKELLEAAIWLGDEKMVKSLVKLIRRGSLALMDDPPARLRRTIWIDSSLIERAKEWDDVSRDALREVIHARISYLSGDEEVISSDEEHKNTNKRQKPNPRLERVEYEQMLETSPAKIESLRKLLNELV